VDAEVVEQSVSELVLVLMGGDAHDGEGRLASNFESEPGESMVQHLADLSMA
jgi:hypothetical protein